MAVEETSQFVIYMFTLHKTINQNNKSLFADGGVWLHKLMPHVFAAMDHCALCLFPKHFYVVYYILYA